MHLHLPIKTVSEANLREHWAAKSRRAKTQRICARMLFRDTYCQIDVRLPCTITLTRIAPRKLDTDNLARSLKAVRDGIADALKVDDGDPRLDWRYAQEPGAVREYGVRVEITRRR